MAVTLGLEGLLEDDVASGMVGNHYVLVAGVSSDGMAAGVVGEELAKQFCCMQNLVGQSCNRRRQNH